MHSIRSRLLILILSIFFLIWGVIAGFIWWRSSTEIDRVFDDQLTQVARLIGVIILHEDRENDLPTLTQDLLEGHYAFPVIFQAWSADDRLLLHGPGAPKTPLSSIKAEGFSDTVWENQSWRVITFIQPVQGQVQRIHVAQPYSIRDHLIQEFLFNILKPLLLLLPLVGLLWFGIQRGLAPLHTLASQISSRDHGNLEPLASQGVPAEVSVMVAEINALFSRLKATLERFSRFTTNVSHELRTPISGIITHAHLALNTQQETARQKSLSNVIKGAKRLNHILDQLLTLARIDPDQLRDSFSQVDLHSTAIEVISECSPAALEKNLELELLGEGPSYIQGNEELTSILLRNLIDNAINATPNGGRISVKLELTAQGPLLQVEDTGPGVPEAERQRIFERFYRLPESSAQGSGLGLSIVQSIVTIHAGSISLTPREQGSGLLVSIQYPAQQNA